MPGAEMGLVDYVPRYSFARAKKISANDEHLVDATISNIRQSTKPLIQPKSPVLQNSKKYSADFSQFKTNKTISAANTSTSNYLIISIERQ